MPNGSAPLLLVALCVLWMPARLSAQHQGRIPVEYPCTGMEDSTETMVPEEGARWYVEISYRYQNPAIHIRSIQITAHSPQYTRVFRATVRKGARAIPLSSRRLGTIPMDITVDDADEWFVVVAARCRLHIPYPTDDNATTIPHTDVSTVINANDFTQYPQSDFFVYRWDYLPNILIFDTRNYRILGALFNRIAFFTEKRDAAGTLYTDEELIGLFAWNGHNYNAQGLARFFNAAHQRDRALNAHEQKLREILLAHNVIRFSPEQLHTASVGGILAVSRESPPYTRQLILQHELLHGIFYELEGYRNSVWEIWDTLSAEERAGWRDVLSHLTYDTENEYVVVNEFQAYMLAKMSTASTAQIGAIARAISTRNPQRYSHAATLVANDSRALVEAYARLSRALIAHSGLRAGILRTLK